jgi:RsmE family RNA methyltransferase
VNLLLFTAAELAGADPAAAEVVLPGDDRRARHARTVLRARPGLRLRAGVAGGPTGSAEVLAVAADGALRMRAVLDGPPSPRPPIDLVVAVPRPKALPRLVQGAAAAGVGRIDLVNAWRVDRSYFGSPRLAAAALWQDARVGCEQGATTWVPEVAVHRLLMPFLRGAAAGWAGRRRVVAHPGAHAMVEQALAPGDGAPVVLAIGPEGGWIDRELDTLVELGFAPVRLGSSILRVDTATCAALAQIALLMRLGSYWRSVSR